MSQPATPPSLTPQFCFSTVALRDFLRLSRVLDDGITQSLNALLTPATAGFDPSSTSMRIPQAPISQRMKPTSCQNFKTTVLFPSWQLRSDILNYCASVATSPDPDDPESVLRETENEKDRESVVDERLDPYSARYFPREVRTERLAAVIRQERNVENIIRGRTWSLVAERCGEDWRDLEDALNDWQRDRKNHH